MSEFTCTHPCPRPTLGSLPVQAASEPEPEPEPEPEFESNLIAVKAVLTTFYFQHLIAPNKTITCRFCSIGEELTECLYENPKTNLKKQNWTVFSFPSSRTEKMKTKTLDKAKLKKKRRLLPSRGRRQIFTTSLRLTLYVQSSTATKKEDWRPFPTFETTRKT